MLLNTKHGLEKRAERMHTHVNYLGEPWSCYVFEYNVIKVPDGVMVSQPDTFVHIVYVQMVSNNSI